MTPRCSSTTSTSTATEFGVEPICKVLTEAGTKIAPSTYYAAKTRPPSARAVSDAATTEVIAQVHAENYGVYGVRKVHAELNRQGHRVARCTVHRLMRAAGLRGISRAKGPRTTIPGTGPDTRPDLVERAFTATAPEPAVGRRHHLLPHLRRLGLRRVRHRRLLPPGGRLAAVEEPAHRPGPGRPRDGAVDPRTTPATTPPALIAPLATRAFNTSPCATPSGWPRPAPSRRSAPPATPTTTPWPRRSTRCSRPSWSATRAPGRASTTSRSPSPSTSTGSTTDASTARSALVPPAEFEDNHYRHNPAPTTVGASVQSLH